MVIDNMFVYHFVDSDLRVEKKKWQQNKGMFVLKQLVEALAAHLCVWLKEVSCKACLIFRCLSQKDSF